MFAKSSPQSNILSSPQKQKQLSQVKQKHQPNLRKAIENYSFSLTDQVGKGFSSKVYHGINDLTGEKVAIKVIEMKLIKTPVHQALLKSEIESLQLIDNENVIRLYKVFQTQNNTYIITNFCEGGDLGALLKKKGQLDENTVVDIMFGVVKGYRQLKQHGIVHRDLKPANILLTEDGSPKIADFGFATTANSRQTMPNVNVGSPLYMSPQALRNNSFSEKSDIWALGVSAYELIYGQVPWQACSEKELAQKMMTQACSFPKTKSVSEDCKSFINMLLIVDEQKRPTIEMVESHQWLRKRWIQVRAQESAKKAQYAQITQVKTTSSVKPVKQSPLNVKNQFSETNSSNGYQIGKENGPSSNTQSQIKQSAKPRKETCQSTNISFTGFTVTEPFAPNEKRRHPNGQNDCQRNSISLQLEKVNQPLNTSNQNDGQFISNRSTETNQFQIQITKEEIKSNDFIVLSQLNFCRYLFKVSQLVEQSTILDKEFEKEKLLFLIFKHLLLKMERLKELSKSNPVDPFNLCQFQSYRDQHSYKQLSQAIDQYDQKYSLQFTTYWLTMFQGGNVKQRLTSDLGNFFNNEINNNDQLEEQLEKILVQKYLRDAILQLEYYLSEQIQDLEKNEFIANKYEPSVILLDYLVTYLQLITVFHSRQWKHFSKQSRIEQIAQGKPVKLTFNHFLEIQKKIQSVI